ncbi:hypothetical protein BC628DRAFT_990665 [Trametes gibbosa]|nr:hypothetical protein BC628DRAFT_990665 [Trametes gibbosa]
MLIMLRGVAEAGAGMTTLTRHLVVRLKSTSQGAGCHPRRGASAVEADDARATHRGHCALEVDLREVPALTREGDRARRPGPTTGTCPDEAGARTLEGRSQVGDGDALTPRRPRRATQWNGRTAPAKGAYAAGSTRDRTRSKRNLYALLPHRPSRGTGALRQPPEGGSRGGLGLCVVPLDPVTPSGARRTDVRPRCRSGEARTWQEGGVVHLLLTLDGEFLRCCASGPARLSRVL